MNPLHGATLDPGAGQWQTASERARAPGKGGRREDGTPGVPVDAPIGHLLARVHALWDELADFGPARVDAARDHLLATLSGLIGAQNAISFSSVRMDGARPDDPVGGWRPHGVHLSQVTLMQIRAKRRQAEALERSHSHDPAVLRNLALVGRFRVNRASDLLPESWFESDYYRDCYASAGIGDVMWAGLPVNIDAELHFTFFRATGQPRFTAGERDVAAYALRGLKWLARQMMLGHGLLVASTPLTPSERRLLQVLLGGLAERQVAERLGLSPNTVHKAILVIYRKFGVTSRAALMALWLGGSG